MEIQNSIALVVVAIVALKIGYNIYKSLSTKDNGLCGGCSSCGFKKELKKKGKLQPFNQNRSNHSQPLSPGSLKYSGRSVLQNR